MMLRQNNYRVLSYPENLKNGDMDSIRLTAFEWLNCTFHRYSATIKTHVIHHLRQAPNPRVPRDQCFPFMVKPECGISGIGVRNSVMIPCRTKPAGAGAGAGAGVDGDWRPGTASG